MDSKLSVLTAITALADEDLMYVAQGGVSKKMTGTQLKAFIPGGATDTPILTGNSTGSESTDLVVTVTNWNSDQTLTISVEAGIYVDNADGTITWTLPSYTGVDDSHNMSVQATEPSHSISAIATHTVSVTEATGVPDQTILYENATINGTTFPTLVNASVATNNIVATADTASATSSVVEQDGGDGDFVNATPTADNKAINYTISAGATTSSVTITGATTFITGDILLMNKTATVALTEIDTTSITTDNGGDSYTFDISGLSFTNPPSIVAKNTASISTSIVGTGAADSFVPRAVQTHTADIIDGSVASDEFETILGTASPSNITTIDVRATKDRNNTTSWVWSDTIRGDFYLKSDADGAEIATVPALDSDDISYCFELPIDNASNTDGSITSVTKNNDFMSAVSYTGTGVSDTVGHSLGIAPELIIPKDRDIVASWSVNGAIGGLVYGTNEIPLETDGVATATTNKIVAVTASTFELSTGTFTNNNGSKFIAYCFASVAGKCKVGTVTISGGVMSGDTDLGFPLGLGMLKPTNIVGNWEIIGSETTDFLEANTTDTESTNGADRVTVSGNTISNNGLPDGTYVLLAVAKEYGSTTTLITDVFDTDTRSGRDFKVKAELADSGDTVSRISIPIQKLG